MDLLWLYNRTVKNIYQHCPKSMFLDFRFIILYLKNGYFLNIQLSEDAGAVSIQNIDPIFDTVVFTSHYIDKQSEKKIGLIALSHRSR